MKTRRSYLNTDFQVRAEPDTNKRYIEGYFIVTNQETNLFGEVYEEVSREAVTEAISNNKDIRALLNHNAEIVLGRTGNKTVTFREDDNGLFASIEINENDSQATNALARVERGDMAGASFGFIPIREDIEEREDGTVKFIIREMELLEISPVTFPAYPTTAIAARSKDIKDFREKKLQVRKLELMKKLKGE